jgi:ATP-dependent Clp protease ATP-binding subunit ClpC
MFERYTEKARRAIFFARYEASIAGSPYIEPEHLLLGVLREDKDLVRQFLTSHAVSEEIRAQIDARTVKREKISTSVDLPLSADSRRILNITADEAPSGGEIDTPHLLLGILRLGNHFAASLLEERGLTVEGVRRELTKKVPAKPTACRDCRHLILDESKKSIEWSVLFCAASPTKPVFDCYTGEIREPAPDSPLATRFKLCAEVNLGNCRLFDPRPAPNP